MHNFPITKHNTSQSADWKIAYSQSNSSGNSYLRRANGQWDSQLRELIDRRWCWTWAVGQLPPAGGPILWVRSTSTFWELPHKLNPELLQLKTETSSLNLKLHSVDCLYPMGLCGDKIEYNLPESFASQVCPLLWVSDASGLDCLAFIP